MLYLILSALIGELNGKQSNKMILMNHYCIYREVGGEVTGVEELRADGVYFVRRDINVRPGGRLKITPGVTLKFEHSIGK